MAAAAVRPLACVAPPSVRPRRAAAVAAVSARPATKTPTLHSASASSAPLPLTPEKKKVLVPIGMGTEEMEAVILVDVLRRAGADVLFASVEPELQVLASSGTRLVADVSIEDCAHQAFDLVALPGGMPGSVRLRDCETLKNLMIRHTEGKRLYGAICAAPAVTLMPWGLHKKKQITCHPAFLDKLPTFRAVKSNVQVSGELTTSRGPGTAFEFALSFVEQLFGDNLAKDIGRKLFIQDYGDQQTNEEFNKAEWSFSQNPHVLVPIANGSEEMEVVILVDILRRAKMNVVVASVEKSKQIVASQKTKIVADKSLADASTSAYDLIILPGGVAGVEQFRKSRILKKLLQEQMEAGRMYGGISSSPTILQKQGLLKDKIATAHPAVIGELNGVVVEKSGVVIDGKLITSRGLGTVIDLSLAVVHKFFGHGRARSVAEGLVFKYPES